MLGDEMKTAIRSGALLHAKHAYMPNRLGFCGPDDHGLILQHLQESNVDDRFIAILRDFEAAYPFVHLIGESNQAKPFDRKVVEAYWIGNSLLSRVPTASFYNFALKDLRKKNREDIHQLFLRLRDQAIPHHTFYVLGSALEILSSDHHTTGPNSEKISDIIDNCRISLARVLERRDRELVVQRQRVRIERGKLRVGQPQVNTISYDPSIPPFGEIAPGQRVSVHWNHACEVLSGSQAKNLRKFTERDLESVNRFLTAMNHQI
jgi:Family of unknown function (DUF6390)